MDENKPTEAFLRSIDIHELLPQQEPFVMIDTMTGYDANHIVTQMLVRGDNIFVSDGMFSASGLIENIAQTCAARIGYVNKYVLNKGIQIGVIGAIRNLCIEKCPKVGDLITTSVEIVDEVFGMTLANATVRCNGATLATTEIKIAVRESPTAQS